jgi:hypothetical protein
MAVARARRLDRSERVVDVMGPVKDPDGGDPQSVSDSRRLEWRESVAKWVEFSCGAQGVSVKVTDVAILGQVAVLLVAGRQPDLNQTRQTTSNRSESKRVRPLTAGLTIT